MDFIAEFVVEFIFELLFEGGEELCKRPKVSKWIRYPILILFFLLYAAIVFFVFFISWISWKESILASIFMAALGVFFIVGMARKVWKEYLKYHS